MIFPKAKKIAKELTWHKTKEGVFGLYKGYFFNVGDGSLLSNPQYKYVSATTDTLTEKQKLQIKTELETNKKLLKFSNFEIGDNSIFVQYLENLTYTKLKTVYTLVDFMVDLFKKLDISEQNKCHNCGTKDSIKYYELNDSGVLLCNSCFRQIENNYFEIGRKKISEEKLFVAGYCNEVTCYIQSKRVLKEGGYEPDESMVYY